MGLGGPPDALGVREVVSQLLSGARPQRAPHRLNGPVYFMKHIERRTVAIDVAERRAWTMKQHFVFEAQTNCTKHALEDARQREHAGPRVHRDPFSLNLCSLSPQGRGRFE